MMRTRLLENLFGAILFAVSLGGCGTTQPSKFFLLNPIAAPDAPTSSRAHELRLGVGPIDLPEYLNRAQIVTRTANTELRLADNQRWAEPLQENFARVLSENLSGLLETGQVHVFPWRPAQRIDYQVTVNVARFEGDATGTVSLVAHWDIRRGGEKTLLSSRRSVISVPAQNSTDYESLVAASSAALAQLSREIAAAIKPS
jgi:uncharacterized protein